MDSFLRGVWRAKHGWHTCSFLPAAARDKLETWKNRDSTIRVGLTWARRAALRSVEVQPAQWNLQKPVERHKPARSGPRAAQQVRQRPRPLRSARRREAFLSLLNGGAPVWARESKKPATRCGDWLSGSHSVIMFKETFPTKKTVDYWFVSNDWLHIVYNNQ